MAIDIKDIFIIALSTTSLFLSLYQLWDFRRKKIKIYFGTNIELQDDIIMHFLTFSVINESNRPLHVFDTRFYLYPKNQNKIRLAFFKRINDRGQQVYFGSTQGHIYSKSLDTNKPHKIILEAYEVYSHHRLKRIGIQAIRIELIDMDGEKHQKKICLNQLEHDENSRISPKEYSYPARFYKYEDKIRKQRKKELKQREKKRL